MIKQTLKHLKLSENYFFNLPKNAVLKDEILRMAIYYYCEIGHLSGYISKSNRNIIARDIKKTSIYIIRYDYIINHTYLFDIIKSF